MGINQFLSFSALSPGAEGPQAALDLYALVPPTGLDPNMTFLGAGNFAGTIAIEGSPSAAGDDWSILAQFRSGAGSITGSSFSFSPVIASGPARRLRLNVRGRILGTTSITVGAEQNCSCSAGGGATGPTGPQGATGPAGPTGPQGATGPGGGGAAAETGWFNARKAEAIVALAPFLNDNNFSVYEDEIASGANWVNVLALDDPGAGPVAGSLQAAFVTEVVAPTKTASALSASTHVWFFAVRGRIVTSGLVATDFGRFGFSIADESYFLSIGYNGATSLTNYVCTSSSGFPSTLSTIPLDDNYHIFRMWFAGGDLFFQIDSEAPIGVAGFIDTSERYNAMCLSSRDVVGVFLDKIAFYSPVSVS